MHNSLEFAAPADYAAAAAAAKGDVSLEEKAAPTTTLNEAPKKKETPEVAEAAVFTLARLPVSPFNEWLAGAVYASPESIISSCLFLHALCAATFRCLEGGAVSKEEAPAIIITAPTSSSSFDFAAARPQWCGVTLSAIIATTALCVFFSRDGPRAAVDKWVPGRVLRTVISHTYGLEFLAVLPLSYAPYAPSKTTAACLAALGVCALTQAFQFVRIQRKTTGTRPVDKHHVKATVIAGLCHHLGTFVYIPNVQTALFVAAWRVFSLSTHSLDLVDSYFKPGPRFFEWYGVVRYFSCVGFFQSACLACLVAHAAGLETAFPRAAAVGAGLLANRSGHASYMLFRSLRLSDTRHKRNSGAMAPTNLLNTYGRQKPLIEIESAVLGILAFTILVIPCC